MPIVLVVFLLSVTVIAFFHRRRIASQIIQRRQATSASERAGELTAEQLAGSINANANSGSGHHRPRRTRRPRRTPSQISTTSLPAYAKEPGEQEVVIFRGREDIEDTPMPTAVVMEPLPEDSEESMHSGSQPHYPPVPDTPVETPLLAQEDSEQLQEDLLRRSVDTVARTPEAAFVIRGDADTPGHQYPRGEAPGYAEVFEVNQRSEHRLGTRSESPATSAHSAPQRLSGIRTILSSWPNRVSLVSDSHRRTGSGNSLLSSEYSHHTREASARSHRITFSRTSNLFNVSPLRRLSRHRSFNNGNLTSPSTISPKAGPTPEQMKLISSRESFTRFGVPYGPDAIAFASSSRQNLNSPPPGFDEFDSQRTSPEHFPSSMIPTGLPRPRTTSVATETQLAVTASPVSYSEPSSLQVLPIGDTRQSSSPEETHLKLPQPIKDGEPTFPSTIAAPAVVPSPKAFGPQASTSHPDVSIELAPMPVSNHENYAVENPPSSFRPPNAFYSLESRASSVQTFATAAESINHLGRGAGNDDDASDSGTPSTPKLGIGHAPTAIIDVDPVHR